MHQHVFVSGHQVALFHLMKYIWPAACAVFGMFYQFGIGGLFANPVGGNASTPSGPVRFGTIKDVNIDISQKLVELRGQNKGPDDVAPSDMKVSFKSAFAELDINAYNVLMFGDTVASGINRWAVDEAGSVPASSTYTITVTHSANYLADYGVRYSVTGAYLKRVTAGSEVLGAYSVVQTGGGKGVYTFAAADANAAVLLSYEWTDASTGRTLTVTNHIQGYGPTFSMFALANYKSDLSPSNDSGIFLYRVRLSKMSLPFKSDGYIMSDLEGDAYPTAAGKWFDFYESDTNQQE